MLIIDNEELFISKNKYRVRIRITDLLIKISMLNLVSLNIICSPPSLFMWQAISSLKKAIFDEW